MSSKPKRALRQGHLLALGALALLATCSGGAPPGGSCATAADCKSGLVCVPVSDAGVCQAPGSSCASGAACRLNEVCRNDQCVPIPDAGPLPGAASPDSGVTVADGGLADAGDGG